MTQFFGRRADAPRWDDATEILTPVGELCLHCEEPIKLGDRGTVMPVMASAEKCEPRIDFRPAHLECDLRGIMSHIMRECQCFVAHESLRVEALVTLVAINRQRAEQGMGPL